MASLPSISIRSTGARGVEAKTVNFSNITVLLPFLICHHTHQTRHKEPGRAHAWRPQIDECFSFVWSQATEHKAFSGRRNLHLQLSFSFKFSTFTTSFSIGVWKPLGKFAMNLYTNAWPVARVLSRRYNPSLVLSTFTSLGAIVPWCLRVDLLDLQIYELYASAVPPLSYSCLTHPIFFCHQPPPLLHVWS